MIWLTWRQHRGEAYVIGGVLAALAIFLIVSGRAMATTYDQLGVGRCLGSTVGSNCSDILDAFRQQWGFLLSAMQWLNFIPALIGILVGAPLVARELEHGTHRMVWTQGTTRLRWLTVKLGLVIAGCLLAEGVFIALLTWWRGPFSRLDSNFSPNAFDLEGAAPLAYMAFALAVAVAAGTLLRRALPAMVLTIALFLGARLPIDTWVRPHYQAPVMATYDLAIGEEPTRLDDWVVDDSFIDSQGHTVDFSSILASCDPNREGLLKETLFQCASAHGYKGRVTYQPADRLVTFQAIETALYLAMTAGLLGLTVFWVRRRVS